MNEITLYTTNCPKCRILESKLENKNIPFSKFTDIDEMMKMGLRAAPYLKVNDKMMSFAEANTYINSL